MFICVEGIHTSGHSLIIQNLFAHKFVKNSQKLPKTFIKVLSP